MTAAAKRERRSRRLVVERDFQYRFTLMICLYGGGLFLIFGGIMLYFLKANYEIFIQEALIQMPDMVSGLKREFRLLSLGMITGLLVLLVVLFGLGLVLTQRIAGPIFALKRRLKEFADGKTGIRLTLRTADEFHNLEEIFNLAMERYDYRKDQQKAALLELLNQIEPESRNKLKGKFEALLD